MSSQFSQKKKEKKKEEGVITKFRQKKKKKKNPQSCHFDHNSNPISDKTFKN